MIFKYLFHIPCVPPSIYTYIYTFHYIFHIRFHICSIISYHIYIYIYIFIDISYLCWYIYILIFMYTLWIFHSSPCISMRGQGPSSWGPEPNRGPLPQKSWVDEMLGKSVRKTGGDILVERSWYVRYFRRYFHVEHGHFEVLKTGWDGLPGVYGGWNPASEEWDSL